jgi:hypothetical protein
MYRRLLSVMLFVLLAAAGKAQVSVSVQEPPAGIVQKKQLWNLSLIYSGNNPVSVMIGLTLVDLADNQPVLTAYTRPVTLTKGVKQLKSADIEPIDYQYFSPAFGRLGDALLPIGNFQACYTVYTDAKIENQVLSESCIPIEVQPLSPPQLTMPTDSALIQQPWPQFSWLPPAPVTLFNDLNYDLLVTEVRSDQTAGAAIQENMPVYNMRRLTTLINNYPSSAKRLDTGKVYAWRVIAKNGENYAAQSEVWTFRVTQEQLQKPERFTGAYIEVKQGSDYTATVTVSEDLLGVKFYSYEKSHESVIRFLDEKGEVIKEIKRTIDYGNNLMVFKLDQAFKKDVTYFIDITDLQMSHYRASFRMAN